MIPAGKCVIGAVLTSKVPLKCICRMAAIRSKLLLVADTMFLNSHLTSEVF
jgi:hypothetical protein